MKNTIIFDKKVDFKQGETLTFFLNENLNFKVERKIFSAQISNKIKVYLKNLKFKKKEEKIISFDISEKNKILFIKVKEKLVLNNFEELGANFYSFIKTNKIDKVNLYADTLKSFKSNKENTKLILNFVHGFNLKSYSFNKYKTQNKNIFYFLFKIISSEKTLLNNNYFKYKAIESGVFQTRNLVSEPPNILYPKKYVEIIKKLSSLGLKIQIYNESKMKKLGMNAILGVGRGSINESFLVTIEWRGNKKSKNKPLAFVGKGVCFDTGGISLKPARFMEEMKYDMAGSAVVVGLLKTLALRKAKVNAIGVVGLVENMPGGNAQKPGDIVKSYSGKTIEVLNTDAEGRLVLSDALSFAEKKFNPKFIIDLATLTGAIIVSLGEEYAGLFSNNDDLSNKIFEASKKIGEKVWRLPLNENYNKLMDSTVADVQNINYSGGAGSITAAQFLQRFIINKTPWAHLDIAGVTFSKKASNLNPKGATGFGVRLLNKLIEEYYE
jgi:leucyl aminopeptidase|tara:strand:+ start:71 stop:1558 length:1488 start_codon:yes stop_codon:yes gene_type:complete